MASGQERHLSNENEPTEIRMYRSAIVSLIVLLNPGVSMAQDSAEGPQVEFSAVAAAIETTATLFGQLPVEAMAMICDSDSACVTPSRALRETSRLATGNAPFAVAPSGRVALLEDVAAGDGIEDDAAAWAIGAHLFVYRGDFCEDCECCIIKQSDGLVGPEVALSPMTVPDGFIVLDLRR